MILDVIKNLDLSIKLKEFKFSSIRREHFFIGLLFCFLGPAAYQNFTDTEYFKLVLEWTTVYVLLVLLVCVYFLYVFFKTYGK